MDPYGWSDGGGTFNARRRLDPCGSLLLAARSSLLAARCSLLAARCSLLSALCSPLLSVFLFLVARCCSLLSAPWSVHSIRFFRLLIHLFEVHVLASLLGTLSEGKTLVFEEHVRKFRAPS